MKYPRSLRPNRKETYVIDGVEHEIPVVDLCFKQWEGKPIGNTFGGKYLIDFEGLPMFAELATQRIAVKDGWDARWVETYAMKRSSPYYFIDWLDAPLTEQISMPPQNVKLEEILKNVSRLNNQSYSGCWDALTWKDDSIIFIELKRTKKDSVRQTQLNWLKAALSSGLTIDNFLIVQWDFE